MTKPPSLHSKKSKSQDDDNDEEGVLWTQSKKGKHMRVRNAQVFYIGVVLGLLAVVAIVLDGVLRIEGKDKLCLVLDDDFSRGFNNETWFREVKTGGYGTGAFDWTTDSERNSFVEDETLYIVPTLTIDSLGAERFNRDGARVNLTRRGTCSTDYEPDCVAYNNFTAGRIINPVQSARLTTVHSHAVRFGKVEVRARMPTGDWLWPAIWLLPRDTTYGEWPRSGEIDLVESTGNRPRHRGDPRSAATAISTFQFGPAWNANAGEHHSGAYSRWRNYFDQGFHNFVLDWNEKRMRVYIDDPNHIIHEFKFPRKTSMWHYARFSEYNTGEGNLQNPWIRSTMPSVAPFDQPFFLIMNVAVGGNYFNNEYGDLPWNGNVPNAATTFWENRGLWNGSWPADPKERGMAIDSVRMWQKC